MLNYSVKEKEKNSKKVFALSELVKRSQVWRISSQKIVFTNGCFDLLHPGHLHCLQEAADFGDRLIVGLNSDSSVKKLKGENRPIQKETLRAEMLSALSCVDAVVIFPEETPLNLIEAISPDFLVKGGDYFKKNIVGAKHVEDNGGEVVTVKLREGFSTTRILEGGE